jgi:hypothetical protein
MALCKDCLFYSEEYDGARQTGVDVVVVDNPDPEQHFCPMYDNHIPFDIFYSNGNCEFYEKE